MKILLLLPFFLVGCAGSGENGAFTPQDTAAIASTIDTAAHAYNQVRYPAPPQVYPQPYAPVVPVANPYGFR